MRYCEHCGRRLPEIPVMAGHTPFCSVSCADEASTQHQLQAETAGDIPTSDEDDEAIIR
ncbi:MAG TPA: hypothetical protein VGO93_25005 [Candidatus Xenobia bacterium]|jgi:hypothetical protein